MPRLGVVTVGQAPRKDIMGHMKAQLGTKIEVIEAGALDGLTLEEAQVLAPKNGESSLATRMADGTQVVISHDKVLPLVQKRIRELDEGGADLILLMCTGRFPTFESKALIVESQKVVDRALEALLGPEHTLGVFVPLPEQTQAVPGNLSHITKNIKAIGASPYKDKEQLREAAAVMAESRPDLVVLHCMGYNEEHREIVAKALDAPTMVANSIVGRTVAELLSGKAMLGK